MLNFKEFLYLEEAFRVTLYHGTPLENVLSILQKGLMLNASSTWEKSNSVNFGTRAIYLTPEIDLAARYSVAANKRQIPVVLEIDVSSAKRLKKMSYDPMDREEDAWEWEGEDDEMQVLEDDIEKIVKKYSKQSWYRFSLPDGVSENGVIALNGFNLYGFVMKLIWQQIGDAEYRIRIKEIKRDIQSVFPVGDYSPDLNVTPSGTIRVRPQSYSRFGQLQYFRRVPPAAIKFVWVRQSDFPNAQGETQKFGLKHLPHESRDMREANEQLYSDIADKLEKLSNDLDDIEYVKSELQDYIKQIMDDDWDADDSNEVINELESLLDTLSENDVDLDEFATELERVSEITRTYGYASQEGWGESITTGITTWVRVPTVQMQQMMNQRKAV